MKKVFIWSCAIAMSCCSFAQTLTKLSESEAAPLEKISKNGKWACGSTYSVGAYYYDVEAQELLFFEGGYSVGSISDNGIMVGADDKFAAVYKGGEWVTLPLPEGGATQSWSSGISSDGRVIAGSVLFGKGARKPYIWTLQSDNSYLVEPLPYEEKDFTDRVPQATDPLLCSVSGDTIVGRLIDCTGFICLPVYWTKDAESQWQYRLLAKDVVFKEGVELPSIPEPVKPNPMEYFTAEDSVAYDAALEAYEAGEISSNPAYNKQDYITDPDSIRNYNTAAGEYNDLLKIANEKTQQLYAALTDKYINVNTLQMSGNGRYFGATCREEEAGEDEDEEYNSPICFDLNTGKWTLKDFIKDGVIDGVTDNGDIFYATPNQERARTAFVIPAGADDSIEFTEWVKQQTNGELDIKPDFLFSYEYEDWAGNVITVQDTLIVGDVFPSANGRICLGLFESPVDFSTVVYIVDMGAPSGIKKQPGDDSNISVYPNPAKDFLYVNGQAENVEIVDLTGRTIYASTSVSGVIHVNQFPKGACLVKVTSNGKVTMHKVLVTR